MLFSASALLGQSSNTPQGHGCDGYSIDEVVASFEATYSLSKSVTLDAELSPNQNLPSGCSIVWEGKTEEGSWGSIQGNGTSITFDPDSIGGTYGTYYFRASFEGSGKYVESDPVIYAQVESVQSSGDAFRRYSQCELDCPLILTFTAVLTDGVTDQTPGMEDVTFNWVVNGQDGAWFSDITTISVETNSQAYSYGRYIASVKIAGHSNSVPSDEFFFNYSNLCGDCSPNNNNNGDDDGGGDLGVPTGSNTDNGEDAVPKDDVACDFQPEPEPEPVVDYPEQTLSSGLNILVAHSFKSLEKHGYFEFGLPDIYNDLYFALAGAPKLYLVKEFLSGGLSDGCPEGGNANTDGTRTTRYQPITGEKCVLETGFPTGSSPEGGTGTTRSGSVMVSNYDDPPNNVADCVASLSVSEMLSEEYTTLQLIQNVKARMPEYPNNFEVYSNHSAVHAYWDLNIPETNFALKKTQFKFKYSEDTPLAEIGGLKRYVVFYPVDDILTEDVDESEMVEFVALINWENTSQDYESPLYEIDPGSNVCIKGTGAVLLSSHDFTRSGRYSLLKVDVDSKDRMLGGSLDLSMFGDIKDEIGLQFVHQTTGETFGIYDIGNPETEFHIYDSEDDLLSDEQMDEYDQGNLDANAYEQDVVFIRDADNTDLVNFYTTFEATGEVEVIITKSGTELAKVTHELTEDTDFGEILEHVDARIDQPEITSVTLPADPHPDDFNFDSDFSDGGSGAANDLITLHRPGTINYPGTAISEAEETTAANLLLSINNDNDEGGPAGQQDNRDTSIHPADDDLTKVVLRLPQGADLNSGSFTLSSNALSSIRIFAADGQSALTGGDLTLNLDAPSGPLASLASTGTATLWIEGLSEFGDIYLRATHTAADSTTISDQAHFKTVGSLAWNYYFPFEQGAGSAVADTDGTLQRVRFSAEGEDILLLTPEYSAVGQRPVRKRNLSTSANVPLFKYLKTGGQLASNYAKGFIDGAWDGAKSDYEALTGIPGTVKTQIQAFYDNPIKAAKAVIDPIKILIDMSNEERLQLVDTMLANFISDAEENTAWSMELGDAALDYYVSGYITGLASEKLVVMAMGVGVVSKFAQGFKYVLNLSKTGQSVVSTISTANKFKTACVRSLGRFVADKTKMREVQQFVINRLERLNFGSKNTHEVIQEALDGLDDTKVNHMILSKEFRDTVDDLDGLTTYGFVFYKRLAHLIHTVGPNNVSEDMIIGFTRLNARLVKSDPSDVLSGNRYNDLIALFDADNSAAGKTSLAKSLEAYKTATDTNIDAKFFVTDIDQVHSKVYHHFSAGNANRLSRDANGNITLTQFSGDRGWYVTLDKFDTQAVASDRLQLFSADDARYRIEIDTSDVNNNLRVPRGNADLNPKGKIEALTRDDPGLSGGSGGAKQLLLDGSSGSAGNQIFDTLEGRYLTEQEIINLLN